MRRGAQCCWFLLVASLAACAPGAKPAPSFPGKAGTFPDEKIAVGGEAREYRLVVPESVDLTKPAPVVFAFHGMGEDNKDHMPGATGLSALAAQEKFIVVYPAAGEIRLPQGVAHAWALTPEQAQKDFAFFDALLAKLKTEYNLDPDRIYLTGMSNGAYFAHLLGRERSDLVAAVAGHSGELGQLDLEKISSGRKFPVMIIHGDADPVFPVEGARVMRDVYQASGHPVTYVEVPGLGHAWALKEGASGQIWEFFAAHPRPDTKK